MNNIQVVTSYDDFTKNVTVTVVQGSGAYIGKAVCIKCNTRRLVHIVGSTPKQSYSTFATVEESYAPYTGWAVPLDLYTTASSDKSIVAGGSVASDGKISVQFSSNPNYSFNFGCTYVKM